jgi:hypothetical protein
MITEEEWDRLFDRLMPLFSVGIGGLSIALTIMALTRSSPLGQRVYYQDGQYLVNVRYGAWYDLRDFIQPSNPDVLAIFSQYGPDYWSLYDFVCQNIDYRRDIGEFWQTPSETLEGYGDCEDTSILLTSLIRAGGSPNCYVALGSLGGLGHAWCLYNGQILETTYTYARQTAPRDYRLMALFNNVEVLELYPNSLAEVFGLARDESAKLNLIAQALGD